MVEAVDRLDVELLVRGDRLDQAPLDLDPARVGRVDGEAPRGVELDLARDPVAVRENDDVGLLGESGRGGRDERERDERGLSHGPQCNRTARFRLPPRRSGTPARVWGRRVPPVHPADPQHVPERLQRVAHDADLGLRRVEPEDRDLGDGEAAASARGRGSRRPRRSGRSGRRGRAPGRRRRGRA